MENLCDALLQKEALRQMEGASSMCEDSRRTAAKKFRLSFGRESKQAEALSRHQEFKK
jgi:hypothetical protein